MNHLVHQPRRKVCESCELSRPLRHVRKNFSTRPRNPLDSASLDVVMINPADKILIEDSWSSIRYCTILEDAATSARWDYYHKDESSAADSIKYFNTLMKAQYNFVVKSWRLDGGKEFSPYMMRQLASKLGQTIKVTTPYSPVQDECRSSRKKAMSIKLA